MILFETLPASPYDLEDVIGILPVMLSDLDPRPVREQLDEGYAHGGGWSPFKGHRLGADFSLNYPGDPPMKPYAAAVLRDEKIFVYESGWVAIVQADGSFEAARMD